MENIINDDPIVLDLPDLLRAGQVKRWHVLPIPPQTIADHSYNVAIIARHIVHKVYPKPSEQHKRLTRKVIEYALLHDACEVVVSDIPSPMGPYVGPILKSVKDRIQRGVGLLKEDDEVKLIVKLADIMDAMIYSRRHVIDTVDYLDAVGRTFKQMSKRIWEIIPMVPEWEEIIFMIKRIEKGTWDFQPTDMFSVWEEK